MSRNHLVGTVHRGDTHDSDALLFGRAIKERWPMSEETKARWLAKLDRNIENGTIRESTSALKVAATLDALTQRDELAEKYAIPVGEEGSVRILSPSEVAAAMDSTVPLQESNMEPEEKAWPNPPLDSCPLPVPTSTAAIGSGAVSAAPPVPS